MIDPSLLEKPPLVIKGNEVVIMAVKYGVNASTKGIVLETGAQGDQPRCKIARQKNPFRPSSLAINEVHTQF
ncbi:flagella basal body P-ring formation protein FlgA [Vibrio sp. PP-XX7]